MPLAFPRPLPSGPYTTDCRLYVVRSNSQARSGGRLTNIVEYADPVWRADLVIHGFNPISQAANFRMVETWWNSLRGGLRPVLMRMPGYHAPIAHERESYPATKVGTVGSMTGRGVVSVSGVASALTLTEGDYVTFSKAGARYLGAVLSATTSGTTRTIEFDPPAPLGVDLTDAQVAFDRAELIMRPIADSFERSGQSGHHQPSFSLMESRI